MWRRVRRGRRGWRRCRGEVGGRALRSGEPVSSLCSRLVDFFCVLCGVDAYLSPFLSGFGRVHLATILLSVRPSVCFFLPPSTSSPPSSSSPSPSTPPSSYQHHHQHHHHHHHHFTTGLLFSGVWGNGDSWGYQPGNFGWLGPVGVGNVCIAYHMFLPSSISCSLFCS